MPQQRRVGNLLGLAVLATVVERPMHPYEMASVMRARGKDQDMQLRWGSLYTVVRNLEKHGLTEAVGSQRHRGRPERTVYAITEAGRRELVDWTAELIGTPEPELTRFVAGLSVAAILRPEQLVERLDLRWRRLTERIAEQEHRAGDTPGLPRLFLLEAEYLIAMLRAEADWVAALLDDLRTGRFPGLAGWTAWHDTGQLPPELTELAERGRIDSSPT